MLQNYSTWKVARVFFDEPTKEHYLTEISKKSDLAHTSVKKHLEKLKELGIIDEKELERGERTYPVYNRVENEKYKEYRKIDIQNRLVESGLIQYIEGECYPDCIVLFGSSARGEDIEESDIDLYVQAGESDVDLSSYENSLNRNIQLHFQQDLQDYPKELRNNIANGIVMYGYLEVWE